MNKGVADGPPHPERMSKENENPKAKLRNNELREYRYFLFFKNPML